MLRRSHGRHRGLRARCNATTSADRSNETSSGSTPHEPVTIPQNLVIALAGLRPATAEHAQISSPRLKSSDRSSCPTRSAADSPAASPSANLPGRLDPDHKSLPRLSNRHSTCGTAFVPSTAVSSLGGTPAPCARPHRDGAGVRNPAQRRKWPGFILSLCRCRQSGLGAARCPVFARCGD